MAHNSTSTPVVTRYAPSPTGFQHIGGIRTALFAHLYARSQQGTFILRIEDTDKSREKEGSIQHVQDALQWLEIEYDYGPESADTPFGSCIQSERLAVYHRYAQQLIAKGLAYPDPYTNEEVAEFRLAAEREKKPFLYRNHRPDTFLEWDGTRPLRFKVPEIKRYTWHDVVRGELSAGPEMLDDIIIMKADGYPTYNFAHIIDDAEMGVTHIMRGDEFISSTPKFLSLYDALEIPYPQFVTLPPILREDRTKKLGKRDGAKDIMDYRAEGYLPETMVNFLALIGWNPGTEKEIFSHDELVEQFKLEQIQRGGGAFNEEKLAWMNKSYLQTLTDEEFATYLEPVFAPLVASGPDHLQARLTRLLPTLRERIHHRKEATEEFAAGEYDYVLNNITYDATILKWKKDPHLTDVKPRLTKVAKLLQTTDFSTPETIKSAVWPYAEATGKGEVLWPLRVALSGKERSPDPFTLAFILGKSTTLERIDQACGKIVDDEIS